MTDKQLIKLTHALGMDNKNPENGVYEAYRRTSLYYEPEETWESLVQIGYAKRTEHRGEYLYTVTEFGIQAVANETGLTIKYKLEFEPEKR